MAVLDANENIEIVAICDISEQTVMSLGKTYNVKNSYQDFEEMIGNHDFDFINIATPHGLHFPQSILAMRKGINVLVEKPMALKAEDCREMIKVADEENVKLFVVKQNRYNVPILLTKEALDRDKLGKSLMVQCNVMWNRYQPYYDDSAWRGTKELEGGSLHTQVSHFIDLMIWWFGDVVNATTIMDTKTHDIEIEDCGISTIKFESGVIGSIFWTTSVYNKNYEGSITIIGENGTIKIGGKYLNQIDFWDVKSYPLPDDVEFTDEPNNYGKYQGTSSNHHKVLEQIVDQFTTGRKAVVEGTEAIKTIEAIEMIYKNQINTESKK
jgi:predicted dehydrogenase